MSASRSNFSAQGQLSLSLGPERQIFSVSELSAAIQNLYEREFHNIWVAGEISGCKLSGNGHFYFALKDAEAQLRCVLFKSSLRFAKFRPQDGLAVLARGRLDLYAARGENQLVVELLEPQGAGALQLAFEQLKNKLAAEGLFESARKRPLPKLPRRIGIVTSPIGAVLRDMLHVLERRFPGLHVRLFPAQVQGEGSAEQIANGLGHFSRRDAQGRSWADVVIVARGGGSLEDLWTFNEEAVARAVAACSVPVISAVGHETDFTICDFVADLRAPTPSAAAEVVVCTRESLVDQIAGCRGKMLQSLRYRLLLAHRRLDGIGTERSARALLRRITKRTQRLDEADGRLKRLLEARLVDNRTRLAQLDARLNQTNLRLQIARHQHRRQQLAERIFSVRPTAGLRVSLQSAATRLERTMQARAVDWRRRLETAQAHLSQLSPLAVLGRGYAIVENSSKHVIQSAAETTPGEALHVRLRSGELQVIVSDTLVAPSEAE